MGDARRDDEIEENALFTVNKTFTNTQFKPAKLLQEMVSPGWRASPHWQEDTYCKMHMVWSAFTEEQKITAFHNSRAHVNRLKITTGEDAQWELFQKIMALRDDVAVRRALLWDPDRWPTYTPESWEREYLELPGFVGRFVDCYKDSKVPVPFFAWAGLSLLGICCKYNIYLQVGGEELIHNLYTFFVGDAAAGKTYAKDCAKTLIGLLNDKLNTRLPPTVGIEGVPLDRTQERPDLWVNILSQDSTYESVVERLAEIRKTPLKEIKTDGKGTVYLNSTGHYSDAAAVLIVDEVSEQFGKGDWAADKKIAGYTAMYTGKERSKSTISRGEQAYNHQAFSMIVCGAVEWFKGAVTPAMMHGGFVDRSMFIYRTGTHRIYTALNMPVVDPVKEMELAEELIPLVTAPNQMRRRMTISPGAAKLINEISTEEFQREIDVRDLKIPKGEAYLSSAVRREHLKLKIASLLAIGESPLGVSGDLELMPVGVEHIRLSQKLIVNEDRYFQKFLDAVNLTGATEFFMWLHDQFIRNKWEPLSQRALLSRAYKKAAFQIKTVEDLRQKVEILVEGGVLKPIQMKKRKGSVQTSYGWSSQDDMGLWGPYL